MSFGARSSPLFNVSAFASATEGEGIGLGLDSGGASVAEGMAEGKGVAIVLAADGEGLGELALLKAAGVFMSVLVGVAKLEAVPVMSVAKGVGDSTGVMVGSTPSKSLCCSRCLWF